MALGIGGLRIRPYGLDALLLSDMFPSFKMRVVAKRNDRLLPTEANRDRILNHTRSG